MLLPAIHYNLTLGQVAIHAIVRTQIGNCDGDHLLHFTVEQLQVIQRWLVHPPEPNQYTPIVNLTHHVTLSLRQFTRWFCEFINWQVISYDFVHILRLAHSATYLNNVFILDVKIWIIFNLGFIYWIVIGYLGYCNHFCVDSISKNWFTED